MQLTNENTYFFGWGKGGLVLQKLNAFFKTQTFKFVQVKFRQCRKIMLCKWIEGMLVEEITLVVIGDTC